jgi:hypothetical protein
MDQYTQWVWPGENVKIVDNIKNIVRNELRGDYADDLNLYNNE